MSVIRELTWANPPEPMSQAPEEQLEVSFLADGAHHKVYEVKHPAWFGSYVFRVALPTEPHLKMESEMAVLQFLREKTAIPVPRPLVWNSSAKNKLGYEWCLMEKLPGVELRHVWNQMPWEKKLQLADRLALVLSQLWSPSLKFDRIGSPYFSNLRDLDKSTPDVLQLQQESVVGPPVDDNSPAQLESVVGPPVDSNSPAQLESVVGPPVDGNSSAQLESVVGPPVDDNSPAQLESVVGPPVDDNSPAQLESVVGPSADSNLAVQPAYLVGPSLDGSFSSGWRRFLPSNRGPYASCRDWVSCLIDIEKELMTTAKTLLDEMTDAQRVADWMEIVGDDLDIDSEDEFLDLYNNAMETIDTFVQALPEIFPADSAAEGTCRFSLYHDDLRDSNILVDPDTFELTGIIDWESTMTMPDWHGREYPLLFQAPEPFDEEEPRIPDTFDEEDENYNPALVSSRERWDLRLLRNRFNESLEKLGWKDWATFSPAALRKGHFLLGVGQLSCDPSMARQHLGWATNPELGATT